MSPSTIVSPVVSKEIRALFPLWLGCVAMVWLGGFANRFFVPTGFLAFLLGSAALGALAVGHEYTNRTLGLLLTSPVSRRRIFAAKAGVLVPMLLILAALALTRLPVVAAGREMQDTTRFGLVALAGSLFLAPWLTMVCRNPIAGGLFGLSISAALLIGSELVTLIATGQIDSHASEHFRLQVLVGGVVLSSVIGAAGSWRTFMGLELIEGSRGELRWPRWLSGLPSSQAVHETAVRRHPVINLILKELRLQYLTFAVSALFVCGWSVTLLVQRLLSTAVDEPLVILTVVHGMAVALLSGSIASAEERNLGVLESQILMPMPVARQWAVKTAVVFGVCAVLALLLPAALAIVSRSAGPMRINVAFAAVVMLLTGLGLYISSVSTSGVQALIISGPALLSMFVLLQMVGLAVLSIGRMAGVAPDHIDLAVALGPWATSAIALLLVALLVRFALANHRSGERAPSRLWRQILWMSGSVAVAILVALAIGPH
jgi:hypothetical protein